MNARLLSLAAQIEKLNFMLEFAAYDINEFTGIDPDTYLDELRDEWAIELRCRAKEVADAH